MTARAEPRVIPIPQPERLRCVCFDAVGTLVYPCPEVAEVYARIGRRCGSWLGLEEIERRFHTAFERQEDLDRHGQQQTSEEREVRRWQGIVRDVFADVPDTSAAFAELWQHFAQPTAWACYDDVEPCFAALSSRGLRLGIASNFDRRLRAIVAGSPPLSRCEFAAISSEIGWRKPAPEFFAGLIARACCPAQEILLVGDDVENDFGGGQSAGLQTVLLDRHGQLSGENAIKSLKELATGWPGLSLRSPG